MTVPCAKAAPLVPCVAPSRRCKNHYSTMMYASIQERLPSQLTLDCYQHVPSSTVYAIWVLYDTIRYHERHHRIFKIQCAFIGFILEAIAGDVKRKLAILRLASVLSSCCPTLPSVCFICQPGFCFIESHCTAHANLVGMMRRPKWNADPSDGCSFSSEPGALMGVGCRTNEFYATKQNPTQKNYNFFNTFFSLNYEYIGPT